MTKNNKTPLALSCLMASKIFFVFPPISLEEYFLTAYFYLVIEMYTISYYYYVIIKDICKTHAGQ